MDYVVGITTLLLVAGGLWYQASKIPDTACEARGIVHEVTLQDDTFSTPRLNVVRCDLVRITNTSSGQAYRLAFGTHEDLVTYPGFSMQNLGPQEYFEIGLVQPGVYTLHDHIRTKAEMVLDISNN